MCRVAAIGIVASAIGLAAPAAAEVALDGTLGPGGPLAGPAYQIGAELGRQSGPNLFHSFARFSLDAGESATFSGPGAVANIIGRVTGGQASAIDGTLRSTIPGANLYLLNPAGIAFGPNAQIDVQGAFHAATADHLDFADGARFSASDPAASTLTTAVPAAFGFLGPTPAALSVTGAQLRAANGGDLTLTAGRIDISGAELSVQGGRLELTAANNGQAPAGAVLLHDLSRIAARPAARNSTVAIRGGQIVVDASQIDATADPNLPEGGIAIDAQGTLALRNTGTITLDAAGGANGVAPGIAITSVETEIRGGQIATSTAGLGASGPVTVSALVALRLSGEESDDLAGIRTLAKPGSLGDAGDIAILAGRVSVASGAAIDSSALSLGRAGTIAVGSPTEVSLAGNDASRPTGISTTVGPASAGGGAIALTAGRIAIASGAAVTTTTQSAAAGGDITVFAGDSLRLAGSAANGAAIASETRLGAAGKAGDIRIDGGSLMVEAGGVIASRTFGAGAGGAIAVSARDAIRLDGGDTGRTTGLYANAAAGSAGATGGVSVSAPTVSISAGAQVNGSTFGAGSGAPIAIAAADWLRIAGSPNAPYTGLAANAEANSTGDAGAILIDTGTLTLESGGIIGSLSLSTGRGGDITILAREAVVLAGGTAPFTGIAASAEPGSIGDAGSITIDTGVLTVANNAQISTSTFSTGTGGDIQIVARDRVTVSGSGGLRFTGIAANASPGSTRNGGTIAIATGRLLVENVAEISSSAFSSGDGGDVRITVANTLSLDGRNRSGFTGIFATSQLGSLGQSGSVQVTAGGITIGGGAEISTSTFGQGPGGDLIVTAFGPVTVAGTGPARPSAITARSGSAAAAGSITLAAANLTVADGAGVTTQARTAAGGNMQIQVSDLVYLLRGGITTLVSGGSGGGGNILIARPGFVVLNQGQIVANAVGGNGGNITIDSAQYLSSIGSVVSATSTLALPGVITILAPEIDVSGGLVQISVAFLDASGLLRDSCAARGGTGPASSLVSAGRGGLPLDPEGSLAAFQPTTGAEPAPALAAGAPLALPAGVTAVTAQLRLSCHNGVNERFQAGPMRTLAAK